MSMCVSLNQKTKVYDLSGEYNIMPYFYRSVVLKNSAILEVNKYIFIYHTLISVCVYVCRHVHACVCAQYTVAFSYSWVYHAQ